MIDINELRMVLARHGTSVLNEDEILELLDRLEDAESDTLKQARLNGVSSEREAALMAKLEAVEKERDALRAELDALERHVSMGLIESQAAELTRLRAENRTLRAELDALKEALNKIADGYYKSFEQHEVALRMQEIARKALTAAPKPEESK